MQGGCRRYIVFFLCLYSSPCFALWYCCCKNGDVIASYSDWFICNDNCSNNCGGEGFCIERDNIDLARYDCEFTYVNLTDFLAQPAGESILITWETASEIDNAGFHLWRSDARDGEYSRITASLIPAEGGPPWGAEYEYKDIDVKPGRTYYYKLEDIDYDGLSIFHGPISAWVGVVDIKANGSDGPVVVSPDTAVSVSVGLNPGEYEGQTSELWLAVNTPFAPPFDWYTYRDVTGWQTGLHAWVQRPLFDLSSPLEVLNMALPVGSYIFYFGVDAPDGMATGPWLGLDSVEVEVR